MRPWVVCSHTLFASSFPMEDITLMSSIGQSSKSSERTRDKCVPRFRCIPEHSIHMRAPRFKLAQSGSGERGKQTNRTNKPSKITGPPNLNYCHIYGMENQTKQLPVYGCYGIHLVGLGEVTGIIMESLYYQHKFLQGGTIATS